MHRDRRRDAFFREVVGTTRLLLLPWRVLRTQIIIIHFSEEVNMYSALIGLVALPACTRRSTLVQACRKHELSTDVRCMEMRSIHITTAPAQSQRSKMAHRLYTRPPDMPYKDKPQHLHVPGEPRSCCPLWSVKLFCVGWMAN